VLKVQPADRLKHFKDGEPTAVQICRASVAVLLITAIADFIRATGAERRRDDCKAIGSTPAVDSSAPAALRPKEHT
jgi:hypothetical protein